MAFRHPALVRARLPIVSDKEKDMAKGYIIIHEEMCKGCEFCTMVCPYHLIQMAEHYNTKGYKPALFVDAVTRCTGCMLCGMICPEAVITVFREVKRKSVIPTLARVA